MKTQQDKLMDTAITRAYEILGDRRQINIMDIPKLYTDARRDIMSGLSVVDAVSRGVEKYCYAKEGV